MSVLLPGLSPDSHSVHKIKKSIVIQKGSVNGKY